MTAQEPFVIVGGGLAGAKAAETLRAEGFDGPVVLVAGEPEVPYERPPLSKDYLLGKADRESPRVHPADWYGEHDVDLRTGVRATHLDTAAHRLTLETGEELPYASCCWPPAPRPGGSPCRAPTSTASATCARSPTPTGCSPTSPGAAGGW